MPANAATEEACPLGKLWLATMPVGSCQTGRSRPNVFLIVVVASEVATMTPAVNSAARRWPRTSRKTARITV